MTSKKANEPRIRELCKRLAFMSKSTDKESAIDQMAFNSFWDTLMDYMGPDGRTVLEALSSTLDDAEVGLLILSMTRAMVAKRSGTLKHNGLEVMAKWVMVNALQSCSAGEVVKAQLLNQPDCADGLEEEVEVPVRDNRMELATTDGNVIDLTAIFNRKH